METTTARVLGPADGKSGFLGSIGVRFMIGGHETDGGFSLVEHPMGPRALAAPLHRHTREDEYSFVLEGTGRGPARRRGGARDGRRPHLQAARPVAHLLERRRRDGADPGDHRPAGFETFFEQLVDRGGVTAMAPDDVADLCARHGFEMDPDSVPGLCERFGVRFPADPV
jgi:hypothetical protein